MAADLPRIRTEIKTCRATWKTFCMQGHFSQRSHRALPSTNRHQLLTDAASLNAFSRSRKSVGWILPQTNLLPLPLKAHWVTWKQKRRRAQTHKLSAARCLPQPVSYNTAERLQPTLTGISSFIKWPSSNTVNVNSIILNFACPLSGSLIWNG